MAYQFEWDPKKAARNAEKHGISFAEAATIFDDPAFIAVIDDEHSIGEERYISIGLSNRGRLLMVAHTDRENRVRIISARLATKKEEIFYAESE
ncbi:MAG: BrnT family toxin [Anaerolineae bacterium]|nr:BrnT family toxin [Anaerolineae bacterium]